MRPIEKAIWYIESHYESDICLDDVADVAGVSRFHLSRTFAYATGMPLTKYLRHRRLTQAAQRLAAGKQDILGLALSLGYGSHEAFSRAFKDCFGFAPEQVRRQGHTSNLTLQEAIRMNTTTPTSINPPTIQASGALLLAGLSKRYAMGTNAGIPSQWQAFAPTIGHVPRQMSSTTFGVVYNVDDEQNHEYLCAVEVRDFSALPDHMARLRLAPQTYAVFHHAGHVSGIQNTCHTIFTEWLPQSGRHAADAPFFERYPDTFDPQNGHGGLEIWLPII